MNATSRGTPDPPATTPSVASGSAGTHELESAEREAHRRLWRALVLGPTIEICEALLRGEAVPVAALDQEWVRRLGRRAA